jgi:hypothetical protein
VPAPVTAAVKEAILARPDVAASVAAGRGGRTRGAAEAEESTSAVATNVVDAAQWIAAWRARSKKAE